jgi:outer membrane protein assembly factor BamB
MKPKLLFSSAAVLVLLLVCAADWPQWRGPDRSDVSRETGLLKRWPSGGPSLLWTYNAAGAAFSGPAVVGDRLYSMGQDDQAEFVFALDTQKGEKLWSTPFGSPYANGYGDGPRGTPTVDGDHLYVLGANGDLACLETATGTKRWSVNLMNGDLGGQQPHWGYAESPLVDGDQVVCCPGGPQGTMAAFDKKTGSLIWRSKELTDPAGYASIIIGEVGGIRQYMQTTMKGVAGVAAKDGKLLWHYLRDEGSHPFRTAVIPTPIFHEHCVYVTAGYGAGCDLLRLSPNGDTITAEKVYENPNMENKHGGVVLVGEHLYGWTDRGSAWICQDFKTGKTIWQSKALGRGSVTCADGRLYCYAENDGAVVLVEANPEKWKEAGRFKIPRETQIERKHSPSIWTHPVVANGRLYLRDQDLIFCFDVKEHSASN